MFFQLRALNAGLRAFDVMDIVPIYQACIVSVGVAWYGFFHISHVYMYVCIAMYMYRFVFICI